MTDCGFGDIVCVYNNFTSWLVELYNSFVNALFGFFTSIVNLINGLIEFCVNGIEQIITFISLMYGLLSTIVSFLTGSLGTIFNTNPYATTAFAILILCINYTFFVKIYNIIADLNIFGWKLPKLPERK